MTFQLTLGAKEENKREYGLFPRFSAKNSAVVKNQAQQLNLASIFLKQLGNAFIIQSLTVKLIPIAYTEDLNEADG